MDYKYIEQLLERYWACETSLEEESILRSFFAQKDVPVRLLPYRDLFCQEQKMAEQHLGDDFDEQILAKIGEGTHTVKVRRLTLSSRLRPLYKAAAGLAILLTFTMAIQQAMHNSTQVPGQPVNVPAAVVNDGNETALTDKDKIPDTTIAVTPENERKTINSAAKN